MNNINDNGIAEFSRQPYLKLTSLDLSEYHVGEKGIEALANFKSLKSLILSGYTINTKSMKFIANINQLTHLNLRWCSIKNSDLNIMATMRNLISLLIGSSGITDENAKALSYSS